MVTNGSIGLKKQKDNDADDMILLCLKPGTAGDLSRADALHEPIALTGWSNIDELLRLIRLRSLAGIKMVISLWGN